MLHLVGDNGDALLIFVAGALGVNKAEGVILRMQVNRIRWNDGYKIIPVVVHTFAFLD